jgi:flagellar biosynthesis/type III secretory pathway chaperone
MNRLSDALARFTAALNQLEKEAEDRIARAREIKNSNIELSMLKQERETLFARIAELEGETRALAGLTAEVEDRLDGAIAEIRGVLAQN